jgi:hypothetical protein
MAWQYSALAYRAPWFDAKKRFRTMPIPGTGRGRHRKLFRDVQTTQELRETDFVRSHDSECLELRVKVRACRCPGILPSAYDDISRAKPARSWKYNRRTRWK